MNDEILCGLVKSAKFACIKANYPMSYRNHLTKRHFKSCDLETPLMQSVIEANKFVNRLVCDEVDRIRHERGERLLDVELWVKSNGGLICRQSFRKYQEGHYYTTSNTFLNLMARYCDYRNFAELLHAVLSRSAIASVA